MSKEKKVIIIGEQAYPLDGVSAKLSLPVLAQLITEERVAAVKECITTLRPYVFGQPGRERLSVIELDLEEELVLVTEEQEVCDEPVAERFVFIDDERGELIEEPDLRRVIQKIRRCK